MLFQLPPNLPCDTGRLAAFLAHLPEGMRCAFEFRHKSWQDDHVYRLLEQHNACFCRAESEELEGPEVITAAFVYCRLRKPDYTPDDRAAIAKQVQSILSQDKTVFLFFKHEDTPAGALYAEEMLNLG